MSCTDGDRKCNNNPITICTSLPPNLESTPKPSLFDTQCRELAEAMCVAVVRTIEQYRVDKKGELQGKGIPDELQDWVLRVKNGGLPDCLDPDAASTISGESMRVDLSSLAGPMLDAGEFANRTREFVQSFGSSLTSFDVDDWHDD